MPIPTCSRRWRALPRCEPVWLPTYAPWLNPIEKLWRWLKGDVLKQHRLAGDWPALRRRVTAFLDQFATGSECVVAWSAFDVQVLARATMIEGWQQASGDVASRLLAEAGRSGPLLALLRRVSGADAAAARRRCVRHAAARHRLARRQAAAR